ncbi:MSMEG_1061 family FMN-dependent PPOX-type flavoprotein [Streptomyces sp. PU-14G]|uniref:MSMEG_1061 family FMN-dependent PPOX-type flavoprotein n=1 Tax=Streptomyces sp. PU-14G TaxID=2800808 RepID=UPI0034DFF912
MNGTGSAVVGEQPPETADPTGFVPVDSPEDLRELLGRPHPVVVDKVHKRLTDADLDMLARSPFGILATSDADGNCDASPRGGQAGFALALDRGTLALPDLPGNRRGDSFHNILENPHVGLVFLVPGSSEVLRINGRAHVLKDAPFFDAMTVRGRRPRLALLVETDEVYLHCPQSLNRSELWAMRKRPAGRR